MQLNYKDNNMKKIHSANNSNASVTLYPKSADVSKKFIFSFDAHCFASSTVTCLKLGLSITRSYLFPIRNITQSGSAFSLNTSMVSFNFKKDSLLVMSYTRNAPRAFL